MPKATVSQPFLQRQYDPFIYRPLEPGWSSGSKVAMVATGIGIAGIAAAYMNLEAAQSLFREQYEFSAKSLIGDSLLAGGLLALGITTIGCGLLIYWKKCARNDDALNAPLALQRPSTQFSDDKHTKKIKRDYSLPDDKKSVDKPVVFPYQEPSTTTSKSTEPNVADHLDENKDIDKSDFFPYQEPSTTIFESTKPNITEEALNLPRANTSADKPDVINHQESSTTTSESTVSNKTDAIYQELFKIVDNEIKQNEAKEIQSQGSTQKLPDAKIPIDNVFQELIGHNPQPKIKKNPLIAQRRESIFENPYKKSSITANFYKTLRFKNAYERTAQSNTLFRELSIASNLIKTLETKTYRRKNDHAGVAENLMKNYKTKLNNYYMFTQTLIQNSDGQLLLEQSYNKLLKFSKKKARDLAINCIGQSGEGCKAIVQKAFTDLISAAGAIMRTLPTKSHSKKQTKNNFNEIIHLAGTFIIACIKNGNLDCDDIIKDAFPILLKKQSLSALKFAIYCLDQPNEKYRKIAESFEDELAELLMFEASCEEKLPGKSLIELMSKKNPNTNEKDVLDFGLDDLRDFQFNLGNTLVKTSDDRSFGEDDDSGDFSKKITDILEGLNSSSEEDDDLEAAAHNKEDDL